jgi:hypothetical protein
MTSSLVLDNEEQSVTSITLRVGNTSIGDEVRNGSHTTRCQLWLYFSVSNFILLVAWADLYGNNLIQNAGIFIYVEILQALMALTSLMMFSLLFTALFIKQTDKVWFLELNCAYGSLGELISICVW